MARAITGIMPFQDPVTNLSSQRLKAHMQTDNPLHLPDNRVLSVHVAETLRQAEGGNIIKRGWIGGDAWFGSIACVVELMIRLQVYSSKYRGTCVISCSLFLSSFFNLAFTVKQNTQFFPKEVLEAILCARHPVRPTRHWVVMKTQISGVDLFTMVYTWSQKGFSFIVSSCGCTDEYDNKCGNDYAWPAVAHVLYVSFLAVDRRVQQGASEESGIGKEMAHKKLLDKMHHVMYRTVRRRHNALGPSEARSCPHLLQ